MNREPTLSQDSETRASRSIDVSGFRSVFFSVLAALATAGMPGEASAQKQDSVRVELEQKKMEKAELPVLLKALDSRNFAVREAASRIIFSRGSTHVMEHAAAPPWMQKLVLPGGSLEATRRIERLRAEIDNADIDDLLRGTPFPGKLEEQEVGTILAGFSKSLRCSVAFFGASASHNRTKAKPAGDFWQTIRGIELEDKQKFVPFCSHARAVDLHVEHKNNELIDSQGSLCATLHPMTGRIYFLAEPKFHIEKWKVVAVTLLHPDGREEDYTPYIDGEGHGIRQRFAADPGSQLQVTIEYDGRRMRRFEMSPDASGPITTPGYTYHYTGVSRKANEFGGYDTGLTFPKSFRDIPPIRCEGRDAKEKLLYATSSAHSRDDVTFGLEKSAERPTKVIFFIPDRHRPHNAPKEMTQTFTFVQPAK